MLFFLLCYCVAWSLNGAEARIWIDATINGQRVRLFFDTGASDPALFRSTAERLKLKLVAAPPAIKLPPGMSTVSSSVTPMAVAWPRMTRRP